MEFRTPEELANIELLEKIVLWFTLFFVLSNVVFLPILLLMTFITLLTFLLIALALGAVLFCLMVLLIGISS